MQIRVILRIILIILPMSLKSQMLSNMEIDRFISSPVATDYKIKYLNEIIGKGSQDAYVLGMYGYFLVENDLNKAFDFITNKIGSVNDNLGYLNFALGNYYFEKGNKELGIQYYYKSLEKNRQNKWLLLELFHSLPDEDKAWEFLDKCLKLDPSFYYALIPKGYYYYDSMSNCSEIVNLGVLPKAELESTDVLNHFGEAYYYCKKIHIAEKILKSSLSKDSNDVSCALLGNIYSIYLNNFDEAEVYYLRLLEKSEYKADAYKLLGWFNYRRGDLPKAEMFLDSLVQLQPNQESFNEIITFYLKVGDLEKAEMQISFSKKSNGENRFNQAYEKVISILKKDKTRINSLNEYLMRKDTDSITLINYIIENL